VMGLFNWLMQGIGFEGEGQDEEQALALAEEKQRTKELKKQKKLAKRLEKQKARNKKYNTMEEEEEVRPRPSETVFPSMPEEMPQQYSTFDPDQYNISSQSQGYSGGYDSGYAQTSMGGYGNKNVIFFYPKSYNEIQKLIEYLKQGESVLLNLDGITDDEAQRMLDFSSGAVYALSGSIQRVAGNIFLLTPEGLGIIAPKKQ
ncbi:MAG: cell division protein SepF, partial [Clostridia bacterium]|nr:cell division protein SepF [Clostridia bacterium]